MIHSIKHGTLRHLVLFFKCKHNLSLPALTEYWLFFDMQKKINKITKKINKIKKKNSEFLFSLLN